MDYLENSNSSPLTRAILENGLGQDVRWSVVDGMLQSYFMLQIRNADEEKLPNMKALLRDIVQKIMDDGLDKQALEASLNRKEFQNRERYEPYGLDLAILATQSWLYGGAPTLYFTNNPILASLRAKIQTSYYEDLLKELFFEDDGLVVLNVLPSATLEAEKATQQQSKMDAFLERLSDDERAEMQKKNEKLALWHHTPDTAEKLATIPHISLNDISKEPLLTPIDEYELNGVHVIRPKVETSGIAYIDLYFELPELLKEEMAPLSLLNSVLLELPTECHDAFELQQLIKSNLGEMSFDANAYSHRGETENTKVYFEASVSALNAKVDVAIELQNEVLTKTKLDCKDRIREIIQQSITSFQHRIVSWGHTYACRLAMAGQTAEGYVTEQMKGFVCNHSFNNHIAVALAFRRMFRFIKCIYTQNDYAY